MLSQPFAFHTTMRSLFVPLQLSAEARKLRFVTNLDPNIDRVAVKTSSETVGGETSAVGVFIGDEQRLRFQFSSAGMINH
jgi:osomolarity two-component system, sensor histidine kinase SLN1